MIVLLLKNLFSTQWIYKNDYWGLILMLTTMKNYSCGKGFQQIQDSQISKWKHWLRTLKVIKHGFGNPFFACNNLLLKKAGRFFVDEAYKVWAMIVPISCGILPIICFHIGQKLKHKIIIKKKLLRTFQIIQRKAFYCWLSCVSLRLPD